MDAHTKGLPFGEASKDSLFSVSRFTHAARGMRYDAPHETGHTAMLRNLSENSLSDRVSNSAERRRSSQSESQMLMETKMSLQTFTHADERRSSLAGPALVNFARRMNDGLSALGRRFMQALHESRQRQANQVIRRYRHLIDDSND